MASRLKRLNIARIMMMDRGLGYTLYYAGLRLLGQRPVQPYELPASAQARGPGSLPTDPLLGLRFVNPSPFASKPAPARLNGQRTINWLIPNFGVGSGGHLNIFRFIGFLEQLGWHCRVVLVGSHPHTNSQAVEDSIRQHFLPIEARVYLRPEDMPPADIGIATSWETAYPLRDWQSCQVKAYFVQDYECEFFAKSSYSMFAEDTYRFGFVGLTAGGWLAETLLAQYGMRTYPFGFSYDKSLYQSNTLRRKTRRLFYYARPPTPRRGFELGLLVLEKVAKALPDVEIVTAGWDLSTFDLSFKHKDLGILPLEELPALYNSCDVCLVISLTNLSLMPLELFACGCSVVSNRLPCVTWCLTDDIAELADTNAEALAQACLRMLEDDDHRWQKVEKAYAFAMQTDWAQEAQALGSVLTDLLRESTTQTVTRQPQARLDADPRAAQVLPHEERP